MTNSSLPKQLEASDEYHLRVASSCGVRTFSSPKGQKFCTQKIIKKKKDKD
uniref:Uncharacterized protein n=1 Tax=Rhizophora mucronata TaxID=61149 RepID=A0A2P2PR06_RHIMU